MKWIVDRVDIRRRPRRRGARQCLSAAAAAAVAVEAARFIQIREIFRMGRILPEGAVERVSFFEHHAGVFAERALAIGTTPAAVALLAERTTAAREAFNAQQLAFERARGATQAFQDAVALMTVAGGDIIKQVKAKAATDGSAIYGLALLPVPATPAPLPPPGTPTGFTIALSQVGALTLRWRCANPRGSGGTIYQVSRQVGASGAFDVIGASGIRRFVDDTLPSGAASVTYEIVAMRSTRRGSPGRFTVNFGVGGQGEAIAATRLAA